METSQFSTIKQEGNELPKLPERGWFRSHIGQIHQAEESPSTDLQSDEVLLIFRRSIPKKTIPMLKQLFASIGIVLEPFLQSFYRVRCLATLVVNFSFPIGQMDNCFEDKRLHRPFSFLSPQPPGSIIDISLSEVKKKQAASSAISLSTPSCLL